MPANKPDPIAPKNVTAQLAYAGVGNPPASHPTTAVGNFFPGLEFNFQNVWKRIFVGIELLESTTQVIGVHDDAPEALKALQLDRNPGRQLYLTAVDGAPMVANLVGVDPDGDGPPPVIFLEWTNSLSALHERKGGTDEDAICAFVYFDEGADQGVVVDGVALKVRRLIEPDTALIAAEAALPGEITESLCSPWQTDYIGCACYYWASNRPDYVNVEETKIPVAGNPAGKDWSVGHNWLDTARETKDGKPFYTLVPDKVLRHEDVMQDWEREFQFVIKGRDSPDGKAS